MEINAKRVQRRWRQEGLKVPRRQRKRQRLGSSEGGTQRLRAERVNHVWSYDFIFDQTEDGRRLKWLPICDEFSRELVALEVERRMESKDVIRILDEAVMARGCVPEFIRSDNGPEFVALAVQEWIARRGFKTLYIKPGSPWQNASSESFNSRFRDEFLNREAFASVLEAKVLGKQHRHWHNQERPHSSLDDQTPAEFAQRSHAGDDFSTRLGGARSRTRQRANLSSDQRIPAHPAKSLASFSRHEVSPELPVFANARLFSEQREEMSAAEDLNLTWFIAEFRRFALLPPHSLTAVDAAHSSGLGA